MEKISFRKKDLRYRPDKTARILKSFGGSFIWLFQTRYDILFEVCNLASNIIKSCSPVEDMTTFAKDSKAAYKKIIDHHLPLKYSPPPPGEGRHTPQLITFCDA